MGQIKKALMETECNAHIYNAHIHPLFADILNKFVAQQLNPDPDKPTTIYGIYANGILLATYLHKDSADYDCWVSRMGEEVIGVETPTQYEVRELTMYTHRPD